MQSYAEANKQLTGRYKTSRKVGNNTYLQRREGEAIALLLHSTDILTFYPDRIVLNTGGWKTVTTKARMNDFLPAGCRVYQESRIWFLQTGGYQNGHATPYADGLTIAWNGEVLSGAGPDPKATLKLKRKVQHFARDYMRAFMGGKVPAPSGGDCWGCLMRADDGSYPIGGRAGSKRAREHILGHIKERYYVPSMLARAVERFPVSQAAKALISDRWAGTENYAPREDGREPWGLDIAQEQISKALLRWLYEQVGLAL